MKKCASYLAVRLQHYEITKRQLASRRLRVMLVEVSVSFLLFIWFVDCGLCMGLVNYFECTPPKTNYVLLC